MTVVNIATGELIDMDSAAAERRAERITLRLDAIADNYRAVLPMIREAIEKRDDIALGYRSPGDYVSDRFGQSLAGLGIEVRRAVVGELTEAGLSTRAIAPVVGASQQVVHNDIKVTNRLSPVVDIEAGGTEVPPEPADIVEAELVADPMPSESYTCMTCEAHIGIAGGTGTDEDWDTQDYFRSEIERHESGECTPQTPESAAGGEASTDSGQTPQGEAAGETDGTTETQRAASAGTAPTPRPAVTGIDGKTYKRPEPRPTAHDLSEHIAADPAVRDGRYMKSVLAVVGAIQALGQYDAERVARIADEYDALAIDNLAATVAEFHKTFTDKRSGLRIIEGGSK